MNIKTILYLALLSTLVFHPLYAAESVWLWNGEKAHNTENEKSKDGFGVQLWLTEDKSFFEKWNKPETPQLTLTKQVKRNKPVSVVILFINPPVDEKGECDITGDMLIRQPDGKVYADIKDFEIWQKKPAPSKGVIELAAQDIKIGIEDKDPLGTYSIDVLIKDRIKNITIPLRYEFIAEE